MKIGILQTGHALDEIRRTQGDYDAMFARLLAGNGFDYVTYNVVDGDFPDGPLAADGWLITGSRHGVYEDHDWLPPLEQLIRDICAARRPLVGICFGHQVIAQALGGRVVKFPGGWVVGQTAYEIDGRTVTLNAWHQDQVVGLPPGATVIGSSAGCACAALAYGDKALSFQPHPEFDDAMIGALLDLRAPGVVPDAVIAAARERLDGSGDSARIAARIAAFFRQERS